MTANKAIFETIEYRVILVHPDSHKLLALDGVEGYRLPRVRIPQRTRPTEQLQKAIRATWGLSVLILDFLASQNDSPRCAVAEILVPKEHLELRLVALEKIASSELFEQQRAELAPLLSGNTHIPASQIGWIDQAILWVESETARKISSKSEIEQLNAGGAFSLIRFPMEDATNYWLKATGEPNVHELSITMLLSKLGGDYLPQLVSTRPEWNAWLMSGNASQVYEMPTEPHKLFRFLEHAVQSMAELQMRTQGHSQDLLDSGAFDQSLEVFQKHSEDLFDYLREAMSLQTTTRAARLERSRLEEIRTVFNDICRRVEDLGLPATIVHGDMNWGNILFGRAHCQFIDWCESYLGNPLISLQHLLLLNKLENSELRVFCDPMLRERYRTIWLRSCNPDALDKGFAYMPLLAIASALYGRGDWLTSPRRNDPHRLSYIRSLARYMDRAVREPDLLEALCH